MGGTGRRPRCRGGHPVSPYPIDRRLRLRARVGTQHLFVVVHRRSCVVSGVRRRCYRRRCWASECGACGAQCGVLARAAVLWLRLLLRRRVRRDSRGAWRACSATCVRGGCVRARAGCDGGGRSACRSCERGVALLRGRRACGPLRQAFGTLTVPSFWGVVSHEHGAPLIKSPARGRSGTP